MPKFSLLQLLVAVSLFPILGALVKTIGSVRPMSLNSDGSLLAVGIHGRLALIDTKKAERIWTTTPPTRYGNPWYIPTSFLLVWLFIANRILGWNIRHKLNRFAARKRHPA